jgi:uncharacterized protein (DUF433 family)
MTGTPGDHDRRSCSRFSRPIIEQVPGKMSGAPVLRHSRMRPQGIISNREMGAE